MKLMDKKTNDLTLKELLIVTGGITAVSIVMMGAIYGIEVGITKAQDKRREKREKKNQ